MSTPRRSVLALWAVLAGQVAESHPVHGASVKAQVEGATLILDGQVPTEQDRQEIEAEVENLKVHGISEVRNDLQVVPEVTDEPGLLVQTFLVTYETAEQAGFAEGYLEGHAHIRPGLRRSCERFSQRRTGKTH